MLSHVPTSVVVVTGIKDDGTKAGMVIGSFTSISLNPQLVGFYPTHASTSWPPIREAGRFVVNVLAQGQGAIAGQFSKKGGDKFHGVDHHPAPHSGAPILDHGIVAWIDCELDQEIELGDHFLVVGRVLDLEDREGGTPREAQPGNGRRRSAPLRPPTPGTGREVLIVGRSALGFYP